MAHSRSINGPDEGVALGQREGTPSPAAAQLDGDVVVSMRGRCEPRALQVLWWALTLLTGGVLAIVGRWYPSLRLRVATRPAPLATATLVVVQRASGAQGQARVETAQPSARRAARRVPSGKVTPEGRPLLGSSSSASSASDSSGYNSDGVAQGYGGAGSATAEPVRFFSHRHLRYVYDRTQDTFLHRTGLVGDTTVGQLLARPVKATPPHRARHRLRAVHGNNSIDVRVKGYLQLCVEEVLSPFYIFQVLAIVLWCVEDYQYYAGCIFAVSAVSLVMETVETRRNMVALRAMIARTDTVQVVRRTSAGLETTKTIDTDRLLPGDVFVVQPGMHVPADAVLVQGGCLVNESMLTGESLPINKTELPPDGGEGPYSPVLHKAHTLFRGTKVVQNRAQMTRGLVVRTGFSTAKGDLIRSILFPNESQFRFYRDGLRFLGFMSVLAVLGFVYTVVLMWHYGVSPGAIAVRGLDLVTTVVPPALPAAMTVGTIYAVARLKKRRIFCISPPRVNVAGKVKLVAFDKTGTLTEDGLHLSHVYRAAGSHLRKWDVSLRDAPPGDDLVTAFACCHSLALSHAASTAGAGPHVALTVRDDSAYATADADAPDNVAAPAPELIGSPLEVQLFAACGWELLEPNDTRLPECCKSHPFVRPATSGRGASAVAGGCSVLRTFPFASQKQRMAVVVADLLAPAGSELGACRIVVKGAPEMVKSLCDPASLPADFEAQLEQSAREGGRVLALASRPLKGLDARAVKETPRERMERDLGFLGFAVFQNPLKEHTAATLEQLHDASIRTVMVTGDNVLTACSVAQKANMVNSDSTVLLMSAVQRDSPVTSNLGAGFDASWALAAKPLLADGGLKTGAVPLGVSHVQFSKLLGGAQPVHPPAGTPSVALAVTGREFARIREHLPQAYDRLLVGGTVFARMTPDQKTQLMEDFARLGYVVCMVGDGANDCGSLKAAHVGISLSEAEASVAAPFTSSVQDIRCVPELIKEGRAALVTSFSCFKFMALYSFIQFGSVMILYWIDSNLGDFQYLYIDLVIILSLAVVMGRTGAYHRLAKQRPPGSLVSPGLLLPLVGQIVIQIVFQAGSLLVVERMPWFVPLVVDPKSDNIVCYENSTIFLISVFQYMITAVAFSDGKPFRAAFTSNIWYVAVLVVLTGLSAYISTEPDKWTTSVLQLLLPPDDSKDRLLLLGLAAANLVVSLVFERVVAANEGLRSLLRRLRRKRRYKNQYKVLAGEIIKESWPVADSF